MSKLGTATNTTLRLGSVQSAVSLYKTTGDRDKVEFEAAGPHGNPLRMKTIAVEAPPEETPTSDPLAVETEEESLQTAPAAVATVPGIPKQILVEEGYEGEVFKDMIRHGVRVDGRFIDLTNQLEQIGDDTILEEMDVVGFVRRERIPRERIQGAYWMAPGTGGDPRVLRLLFEAMHRTGRVGVVRWTKRKNQAAGVLLPHGRSGALLVLQLAFPSQVREPDARVLSPQQAEVTDREIKAASTLIEAMGDSAAILNELEDDAAVLKAQLYADALAGKIKPDEPVATPEPLALPQDLVSLFESAAR